MTEDKYSVAILACGDLLDTLAAIRAGLLPIWGSDTCSLSQKLWKDLVGNTFYGDAFKIDTQSIRRPKILKSGFPCPNYSRLGDESGAEGKTGWMYVRQADIILQVAPRRNNNRTDRQRNKHKQRQRSQQEPEAGCIHHTGNYGEGVGNYQYPHPLQSWWGLP